MRPPNRTQHSHIPITQKVPVNAVHNAYATQMPNIKQLIEKYNKANQSKIGDKAICPSCNNSFQKKTYNQIFCKSKPKTTCKDYYWNNITPNKRNNKTRISPASKRFLYYKNIYKESTYNPDNYEHPFSSDALGQD